MSNPDDGREVVEIVARSALLTHTAEEGK